MSLLSIRCINYLYCLNWFSLIPTDIIQGFKQKVHSLFFWCTHSRHPQTSLFSTVMFERHQPIFQLFIPFQALISNPNSTTNHQLFSKVSTAELHPNRPTPALARRGRVFSSGRQNKSPFRRRSADSSGRRIHTEGFPARKKKKKNLLRFKLLRAGEVKAAAWARRSDNMTF